jgi:aspartate/methionine/tyrosine aminotransferase
MMHLTMPRYKKIEAITSQGSDYISFSQGTVKIDGTPQIIKDYIRELLRSDSCDYYQYVGGIYPLRQKIAEDLSHKFNLRFQPENILITHGAIGGITDLCLALLKKGDQVLLPEPAYPSYQNIIKFSKAEPIYVQGFIREGDKWIFDVENIKQAVTPYTKMIVLSNPSNPCGICFSREDIQSLQNFCETRGIYLVFDEVYDHYIYHGSFYSGTPLVLQSNFVIRTGSFSKDFAMSGWRIGYLVASQELIAHLTIIQDGTLCCPSVIGQHAALFALKHKELIADQVNIVKNNLELICHLLKPLVEKEIFSYVKPQAGIFLFIKTPFNDSENLVMDILQKAKVALVPGKDFGFSQEAASHVRLCFARKESVVREGISRILRYYHLNLS